MWLLMLLGCRQDGTFVKVVIEGGPCALTSTGRVACSDRDVGEEDTLHWVDIPVANDLSAETETICAAGNSGVRCFSQEPGKLPDWAPHIPGKYTNISMSWADMCTLDKDGAVECFGQHHLVLSGGPYVELGTYYSTCGLTNLGGVECVSPPDLTNPELTGTYDHLTNVDGTLVCALSDGAPDCWPKDGDYYVEPPEGVTFTDLHLGDGVICGVKTGGELLCWQYEGDDCRAAGGEVCPDEVIENVPTGTFSQVWANVDTACAVDTDGCMTCWPSDRSWAGDQRICTEDIEQ